MVSNHQTRRLSWLTEEKIRCNCHHGITEKKEEGRWKERTAFDIKDHLDLLAARDIKQEVEEASLAQDTELVASAMEDFREVVWEDRWGLEQEFPELVLVMEVESEVEEEVWLEAEQEHFTKEQEVFKLLGVSEDQPRGSLPPLEGENPQIMQKDADYLLFNSKFQLVALNFNLDA